MSKTVNTPAVITFLNTFALTALNTELESREMPASEEVATATAILASGIRSLDELTATVVNLTEGDVDRDAMHEAMVKCFPEHTISERHVGHYLSLARKGNLSGAIECRFAPAKAARKGRSKFKVTLDVRELSDEQRDALIAAGIDLPEYEA
jgi:hypothetical protein